MSTSTIATAAAIAFAASQAWADDLKLPPEVTPALRAACEADARRYCIRDGSTVSAVKTCMLENFNKLAGKCRAQIVIAGLAG